MEKGERREVKVREAGEQGTGGKYKTWTPGPWTPSVDRVHQNMDRVHGPPIFTTPKITEVNKNKIKGKLK